MKNLTLFEERETITQILNSSVDAGFISSSELQTVLEKLKSATTDWSEIDDVLFKAQGQDSTDPRNRLRQAREAHPLHVSDFTNDELEKLKSLAPDEYEIMKWWSDEKMGNNEVMGRWWIPI